MSEWYQSELEEQFRAGMRRGVVDAIGIVEQEAVRLIEEGPKTGRKYRRRGVVHQASAPGQSPASDTGALIDSRTIELDLENFRALLIFRTLYALMLEVGTAKMEPRPYARRAIANKAREVVEAIVAPLRSLANARTPR
jgi:hypothetical protein